MYCTYVCASIRVFMKPFLVLHVVFSWAVSGTILHVQTDRTGAMYRSFHILSVCKYMYVYVTLGGWSPNCTHKQAQIQGREKGWSMVQREGTLPKKGAQKKRRANLYVKYMYIVITNWSGTYQVSLLHPQMGPDMPIHTHMLYVHYIYFMYSNIGTR